MVNKITEFDGERARRYEEAISTFPQARKMDLDAMFRLLNPQEGERILGFGEGNGYFCRDIAISVGKKGYYKVIDPSKDQLENLKRRVKLSQLEVMPIGVEDLNNPIETFDKVWSFGAFHHVQNQTEAMARIYKSLRKGGLVVICDVFSGSNLAKHFDHQVARYCLTGHEVKFLSDEFAKTLCYLSGFNEDRVELIDLPQKWVFDSEKDIGLFIYNLHALTLVSGTEKEKIGKILDGCKKFLGIEEKNGKFYLNWPMKVIKAVK